MNKTVTGVLFALAMVAVIVTVDLLFLRDLPVARLITNVCIVLASAAIYFRFIARPRA